MFWYMIVNLPKNACGIRCIHLLHAESQSNIVFAGGDTIPDVTKGNGAGGAAILCSKHRDFCDADLSENDLRQSKVLAQSAFPLSRIGAGRNLHLLVADTRILH